MAAYYMNEAMFELPDAQFEDGTITTLAGSSRGAPVVVRFERAPLTSSSLRDAVRAHERALANEQLAYVVLFERERQIAARPAFETGASFRGGEGEAVYSRRTHIGLGETRLILMGQAALGDREACDACVEHILETLRV